MRHFKLKWIGLAAAILVFRTLYGLSQNFWHEDVVQIYLLGLKYFTTGAWPYFGPDVVHTNQQIPGGLQSILIAVPLKIWPAAEAPVILVNILSLTGILLLSRYLSLRFGSQPRWLWLIWLSCLPMTLQFSTNTYNPSYLLLPSILFFVGFFERLPSLRHLGWSALTSGLAMGFSLGFVFQLHLSWPILMPFLLVAVLMQQPADDRRKVLVGILLGLNLISFSLIPTIYEYGFSTLWSTGSSNSQFNFANARNIGSSILRVISLASYEFLGFNLGAELNERRRILTSNPILLATALIMGLALIAQVLSVLQSWIQMIRSRQFRTDLGLLAGCCLWASLLFLMTPRPPAFRNIFLLFPVAALATASIINRYSDQRWLRPIWLMVIMASLIFHGMIGIRMAPEISLYRDRARLQNAIDANDYRVFAERRPGQY